MLPVLLLTALLPGLGLAQFFTLTVGSQTTVVTLPPFTTAAASSTTSTSLTTSTTSTTSITTATVALAASATTTATVPFPTGPANTTTVGETIPVTLSSQVTSIVLPYFPSQNTSTAPVTVVTSVVAPLVTAVTTFVASGSGFATGVIPGNNITGTASPSPFLGSAGALSQNTMLTILTAGLVAYLMS